MMSYNFDRVSDQYDASRGLGPGVADRICRWVLARLPRDPAITEIGVGTGRIALPFIERGIRYTGFDISLQMLEGLQAKLGGDLRKARLAIADVTQPLPLPDQSQDAVVAVHILHLVDAKLALEQVRRVLKPHGALVWGYQWHADDAPRQRIRTQFREYAAQLGAGPWRDFLVQEAREQLHRWGAQASKHIVATWTEGDSGRSVLSGIGNRVMSFTWHLDDEVLQRALQLTEAWAIREYGSLDRSMPSEQRFVVEWYQF